MKLIFSLSFENSNYAKIFFPNYTKSFIFFPTRK